MSLVDIVRNFGKARVAVLGDFCLDRVIYGKHIKFSRESPAPILRVKDKFNDVKHYPGAAANVAYNLIRLGVGQVIPFSIIGEDHDGKLLLDLFEKEGINCDNILSTKDRSTYVYEKVYAQGEGTSTPFQQTYRIDSGSSHSISKELESELLRCLLSLQDKFDLLIVSDYLKGIVTPEILGMVSGYGKRKFVVGTTRENARRLKDLSLIALNAYEVVSSYDKDKSDEEDKIPEADVCSYGTKLLSDTGSESLIVTRGERGMLVFNNKESIEDVPPTKKRKVVDITGAGDTALAAIVASLGAGADLVTAAKIANYAAGIVVQKPGTATTTQEEIIAEIKNDEEKTENGSEDTPARTAC